MLTFESEPDRAGTVSFADTGEDISVVLRQGRKPGVPKVSDSSSWASGCASFTFSLAAGDRTATSATAFVHAGDPMLKWLHRPSGLPPEMGDRAGHEELWRGRLPVQLQLPDRRFAEAFQAQLVYLAMSTVDSEPRISPVSYPLWWLRDGAYVVQALEKGGFGAWADRAVRAVASREPFGGFGAEGDGPSQLIWLMSEHYLMNSDLRFLKDVYPHIERNADLIIKMCHTDRPIFGNTEFRTPGMLLSPQADLMCEPATEGLIVGRMDHHFPLFWVNGWAYLALVRAALCAEAVGVSSERYVREALEVRVAMNRCKEERFGENDRDIGSALWPTGWVEAGDLVIRERFRQFWDTTRCPGGVYVPEPEWTYFEAAQAHNYMILGDREKAWTSIEMFLSQHTAQGLYTYHEGVGDENTSLQWQRARGWDRIGYITPHGWTAAELFLLLRDALIRETAEGGLVIGEGVPLEWMHDSFSARGLPSHFGTVNVEYDARRRSVTVETQREPVEIVSSLPVEVKVVLTL